MASGRCALAAAATTCARERPGIGQTLHAQAADALPHPRISACSQDMFELLGELPGAQRLSAAVGDPAQCGRRARLGERGGMRSAPGAQARGCRAGAGEGGARGRGAPASRRRSPAGTRPGWFCTCPAAPPGWPLCAAGCSSAAAPRADAGAHRPGRPPAASRAAAGGSGAPRLLPNQWLGGALSRPRFEISNQDQTYLAAAWGAGAPRA